MSTPNPVIILTGGSRGTGLAITTYLLTTTPAHVLNISRTSPTPLQHLQLTYPDTFRHLPADLSSPRTAQQVIETALSTWGRIDSLIINHGVLDPVAKIADASIGEWEQAFRTNFFAAVGLVSAALPALRKRGGRVVFVSSGAAVTGYQGWGAYGASKAALNHFCITLAAEEAGVVAVAVRPGVIDTRMQEDIRKKHGEGMGVSHERFLKLKEEGKLLRPEQPGNVIARLALQAEPSLSGKFLKYNTINHPFPFHCLRRN
ncbi:NAD(P)-binding protein [Tuber magnatum]|uniref:NAD(P)-binding protein n=1 Tax=Tuber magnatum TaxID=42249 RepID=A0A317SEZ6_9PEZI|nr:NAD(P)-binding protein [Tuber magnatum]